MGQILGHEKPEKDIDYKNSPYFPLLLEFEYEDQNEDLQKTSDINYSRIDVMQEKNKLDIKNYLYDKKSQKMVENFQQMIN